MGTKKSNREDTAFAKAKTPRAIYKEASQKVESLQEPAVRLHTKDEGVSLYDPTSGSPSGINSIWKLYSSDQEVPHSSARHYAVDIIKKGISGERFVAFSKAAHLKDADWQQIFDVSRSTIARLKGKDAVLDKTSSEKVVELEILYELGKEVFESEAIFIDWVHTPNRALSNKKPKYYFDTSAGISLIKTELVRIDHGILY